MKSLVFVLVAVFFCFAATSFAQVSVPVTTTIGIGGGLTSPSGDYSTFANTGYHGAAKVRFGAVLPVDITGAVSYHHNGMPAPADAYAFSLIQVAAGVEYPFPSPEVKPYVAAEVAFNSLSNNAPNSKSSSREGLNLGAGVQFMSFDGEVKYQMINMMGKDTGEGTFNQITVTVMYTFGL